MSNIHRVLEHSMQALRSRLGMGLSLVQRQVFEQTVLVRYGTVRDNPDYDDAWTYALLKESCVFFDVGCHQGWFSLLACLQDPSRKVVAIDANPSALTIAAENLFLNGFSRQVRFVLAFVSNEEEQSLDFYTVGSGAAGSRYASHARTASARNSLLHVRTTTLDAICWEFDLQPDLVKIDVEGAEADVLAGAQSLATSHQPRFILEMHSNEELPMAANGKLVLEWCQRQAYQAYYLKTHQPVDDPELFAHRGRCHLLLQAAGRPYPAYLYRIEQSADLEKARQSARGKRGTQIA